ncbi:MAG TPA: FAD-binding oxidoreductase [Acidimicrobiales bacterium]|nr:FAD-binding oxidoreductase [Acidimicrobiales bacterium]
MPAQLLTGWGRTGATRAEVASPGSAAEVADLLGTAGRRGVLARGLGRSYGDAAQNAGGTVVDTSGLTEPLELDADGNLRAGAGVSLDTVMRTFVPRGWFVPVTPGTRQVTVGGAVAADVHGKNHHLDGSIGRHVTRIRLVTPTGTHELRPEDDLFWATVGGMGLTGVITEVDLRMIAVESSAIVVDTDRTPDLDTTMALMTEGDDRYRYSVAWIDCLSSGRSLGRSVLTRGDHAPAAALPDARRADPLRFAPRTVLAAPPWAPSALLNAMSIRAFNEAWYRRAPRRERGAVHGLAGFFHPLDGVSGWNRLYGHRGFLQYQLVLPFGQEDVLRRTVERLAGGGCPSFFGVLKRFGGADAGHLSFPTPGWTLALDMPVGPSALGPLLDSLDADLAEAGGRVYLAKDSRLRSERVRAMYPRLEEWQEVRGRADPDGVMCSDLARRLGHLGAGATGGIA